KATASSTEETTWISSGLEITEHLLQQCHHRWFWDRPGGGIGSRPVLCQSTPSSLHKRSLASFTTIISRLPPPRSGCHRRDSSRNHVLTRLRISTMDRSPLGGGGGGAWPLATPRRFSSSWTPYFRYGARSVTSRKSQHR